MIFSEIYGEYFNAVAKILDTAVRGGLNENDIISIVGKSAFGESILSLPQKIKNEKWGLEGVEANWQLKTVWGVGYKFEVR